MPCSSSSRSRRHKRMPASALACLTGLLLAAVAASCASGPYTTSPLPRPDQPAWLDERRVIETVTHINHTIVFESKREQMTRDYVNLLRYCYKKASVGGDDVDAGVRALNYIRQVHRQSSGTRAVWKDVVQKAKASAGTGGLMGIPIPPDYR